MHVILKKKLKEQKKQYKFSRSASNKGLGEKIKMINKLKAKQKTSEE